MGSFSAVFGQTITIDPCEEHEMSSHIIGVCRNHVQAQTIPLPPPGNNTQDFLFAEKLALYGGITPSSGSKLYRFGGSMVDGVPGAPYGLTGWFYPIPSGQTGPYPYDDFQFYLDEATEMNADLLVGVNVGTGTPQQAAQLVTDLIISGDIGRVVLFEMGNELSGFWQAGHQCGPEDYINTVTPFIEAMVAAAANAGYTNELPIGLMGSYGQAWAWTTYGCPAGTPNPSWEHTIDTYIAAHDDGLSFNFICFHGYTFGDLAGLNAEEQGKILQCTNGQMTDERAVQSLMALNHWAINNRITQIQTMLQGTGIQLAETEYATHISQEIRPNITHSIVQALFAADNMMTAIKRDIPIANNYAFFMESSTTTDNTFNLMLEPSLQPTDVLTPKPVFFAHRMIAENLGQVVLRDDDDGTMFGQLGVLGCANGQNYAYPRLSYVSTMDVETSNNIVDGTISTLVINRTFGNDAATINVNFDMPGYTAQVMSIVGNTITDESPQFTGNSADGPEFVDVINMNSVSFAPLSINIIRFTPDVPLDLEFAYKDLGCFNIAFEIPQGNPSAYSYLWDFGDGTTGTDPKHTYSSAGTYMVTMTIQTAPNCTVAQTQEVVVSPMLPNNADYTYTVNADCSVAFTGATGNPPNTTYSWDFGDNTTSTDQNPTHTYTDNGNYSVVLNVTDACGNSVSATHPVMIDCMQQPTCTPCTGTYAYNIDAGEGLKWSQTGLFDFLFQSCLTINGRLIIDKNVSIIGGEIRMGPGAEIVISSGASLELAAVNQNGGIHGCKVMWRGITVAGGGSLITGDDGTSHGTIISDAQYAVRAMNNSTIDIRDVSFVDNYIGVYATGLFLNQIAFVRNKFTGTNNMLAPYAFNILL